MTTRFGPSPYTGKTFFGSFPSGGGSGTYSLSFGPGYYATGSGPQLAKTAYWSIYPAGVIGALGSITPIEGSGVCDSVGMWTVTGLAATGAHTVLARDADGAVYYDVCTAG